MTSKHAIQSTFVKHTLNQNQWHAEMRHHTHLENPCTHKTRKPNETQSNPSHSLTKLTSRLLAVLVVQITPISSFVCKAQCPSQPKLHCRLPKLFALPKPSGGRSIISACMSWGHAQPDGGLQTRTLYACSSTEKEWKNRRKQHKSKTTHPNTFHLNLVCGWVRWPRTCTTIKSKQYAYNSTENEANVERWRTENSDTNQTHLHSSEPSRIGGDEHMCADQTSAKPAEVSSVTISLQKTRMKQHRLRMYTRV